jgi:hypothetical protein
MYPDEVLTKGKISKTVLKSKDDIKCKLITIPKQPEGAIIC